MLFSTASSAAIGGRGGYLGLATDLAVEEGCQVGALGAIEVDVSADAAHAAGRGVLPERPAVTRPVAGGDGRAAHVPMGDPESGVAGHRDRLGITHARAPEAGRRIDRRPSARLAVDLVEPIAHPLLQ